MFPGIPESSDPNPFLRMSIVIFSPLTIVIDSTVNDVSSVLKSSLRYLSVHPPLSKKNWAVA